MNSIARVVAVIVTAGAVMAGAAAPAAAQTATATATATATVTPIPQFGLGGFGVGIAVFDEAGRMQRPSFWSRFAPRVAGPEDHSIQLDGTIGVTVNETVPIPGTDMIKVGQVQEGAYSQNNNRNATSEARNSKSVPPVDAAILVKVNRP